MQPLAKQMTYSACCGGLLSTMILGPLCDCMPSGSVTRKIFFRSPSGPMIAAGRHGCGKHGERPPTRPTPRGKDTEIHCGNPFLKRPRKPLDAPHPAVARGCLLGN